MILQWAGTAEGFEQYVSMIQQNRQAYEAFVAQRLANAARISQNDDDDDDPFEGLAPAEGVQIVGTTGILEINGPMQNEESWWTRLFGICTYQGIRNALSDLASNEQVKDVVVYMDTPGGMVDGLGATAKFIDDIDRSIKPVYAHTAGSMCSAGYHLAAPCRRIYSDEGTRIGSIGVLAIVTEITEMLKMEGINKTVFRSAPYKALNNPFEKQSDKSREVMNEDITRSHNKFVETIAKGRRLEASWVNKNIASGKVFDEERAMQLKMIDGLQSLEVLVGRLNSNRSAAAPAPHNGLTPLPNKPAAMGQQRADNANSEVIMKTNGKGRKGPVALPAAALATLALGVQTPEVIAASTAAEVTDPADPPNPAPATVAATDTPATDAPATPAPAAVDTPPAIPAATDTPAAPAAPTPAPVATADAGVIALLQTQLASAQAAQATAQGELAVARRELETATAVQTALEAPIRKTIERLSVALGATVIGLESAHGSTLVEHFNALNARFEQRFVVGQQTRPNAETPDNQDGSAANVSPIHRRMVAATGLR